MHADATHEWVVQKLELRDKEVEQKVIRDNKIGTSVFIAKLVF